MNKEEMMEMDDEFLFKQLEGALNTGRTDVDFLRAFANRILMDFGGDREKCDEALSIPFSGEVN